MPADNKAIIRRYYQDLFSKGNLSVADEIYASKVIGHALWINPIDTVTSATITGPSEDTPSDIKAAIGVWRESFRDLNITIDDMLEIGDKIISLYTLKGTHVRGTPITLMGIDITRISDGRIVEYWQSWDRLGMYQQLGVVPSTTELLSKIKGTGPS